MSDDPTIGAIEETTRSFIEGVKWGSRQPEADQRHLESLLLRSFRAQCATIPPYGAYVRHLGLDPDRVADWHQIPPVPASAFKSHDLSAAPPEVTGVPGAPGVVFETSGTSVSRPGRVRLASPRLYEVSLRRGFERHLLPDGARLRAVVFGPPRLDAPRSSLWFMANRVMAAFAKDATWALLGGEPRWDQVDAALARAEAAEEPLLLFGTTLLYMAYFERLAAEGRSFRLAPGSRAMDTGGAKGQREEFSRVEVAAAFARHLGILPTHLVNEYGMTELGSQFYDDRLVAAHERREPRPGWRIPPWVRTRVLDPETMEERRDGERGLLVHYDLANLEIPLAIQTEDIGVRVDDHLILEGRLRGAEARGCSLPYERFLAREEA
ncbi:MAG TPA: AMP-binding protein [Candidatus Eisenbacteria bacterium]